MSLAVGSVAFAAWRTSVAVDRAGRASGAIEAAKNAEKNDDYDRAGAHYREALALDPKDDDARLGLAHARLVAGDATEAVGLIPDPENPYESYLAAWALSSTDPGRARTLLAGSSSPDGSALLLALRAADHDASVADELARRPLASPESDLHVARAYAALGDTAAAAAHQLRASAAGLGDPVQPNLVLVVIDTLRADAVGGKLTPHLDAIASASLVFDRAFSAAPWTGASIASLLTGMPPSVHGFSDPVSSSVPDDLTTLAEALHDAGYATAAVVANPQLDADRGFAQGFDRYSDVASLHLPAGTKRRGDDVVAQVQAWLPTLPEPYFLVVHFMDTHWPYEPPDPPAYAGKLTPRATASVMESLGEPVDIDPQDLAYLRGLYEREVSYVDTQVGALWKALDGSKLPQVRVITADHGEEFEEHGSLGHGYTLYDEVVHVPLMVFAPGIVPPRHRAEPVGLIDVMPTLLQLGDAPEVPYQDAGSATMWLGLRDEAPGSAFSEGTYLGQWHAIRTADERTVIYSPLGGDAYVFDHNPGETHPLAAGLDAPEARDPFQALLDWMDANKRVASTTSGPATVSLEDARVRQLEALGYIQGR